MNEPSYIHEFFSFNDWGWDGEAVKARNARARTLRAEGFTVETKTVSFIDLSRDKVAFVEAWKGERNPFGGRASRVAPTNREAVTA